MAGSGRSSPPCKGVSPIGTMHGVSTGHPRRSSFPVVIHYFPKRDLTDAFLVHAGQYQSLLEIYQRRFRMLER